MTKEHDFLEDGNYLITMHPFKEGEEMNLQLRAPSGKLYRVTTPELTTYTRKMVLKFYAMLRQNFPGKLGKTNDIVYDLRYQEKSDKLQGNFLWNTIKNDQIRTTARNLCSLLVAASMAHDAAQSKEETATQEWPLQISCDLREFKLWKDPTHAYSFGLSEILDNSQLMIDDLIDLCQKISEFVGHRDPSEKIRIHKSRKVITVGDHRGIFVHPSKLSSLVNEFFEEFGKLAEHQEALRSKPKEDEGVIVESTICPTPLKEPLDATFCINSTSFGIWSAIFLPYPIGKLPEELQDILIELRKIFGNGRRLYFNPKKEACWKFLNGTIEYFSLKDYPAGVMRNLKIAENWLTLLVRSGEITPTLRDDVYILTVSSDYVHWEKFGEDERHYPFACYPEIENRLKDLISLPSPENKRVYFLNSIGGAIFFAKRTENVYFNVTCFPDGLYNKLWNLVTDESVFVSPENLDTTLPTIPEVVSKIPKSFLIIDFQNPCRLHIKTRNGMEETLMEESLPPHMENLVHDIKEEVIVPKLKNDKPCIAAFARNMVNGITLYIFQGKESMESKLSARSYYSICDAFLILTTYREPAMYKGTLRVYPDKISACYKKSIFEIDRSEPGMEEINCKLNTITDTLVYHHIIPKAYLCYCITLDGFCEYEIDITDPGENVKRIQCYDISLSELKFADGFLNDFKEFFRELVGESLK